jgi:hypothetical protein
MARFDDLPADQKAVLQLVLRQGRAYGEIAGLLKISPEAVRDRALTALRSLGPADRDGLAGDERDEAGDYLLGQQDEAAQAATRAHLEASGPARTWARAVADELRTAGVAPEDRLPEIPAGAAGTADEPQRSSRLGGVLLLGGVALIVALAIVLIATQVGGNDSNNKDNAAAQTTTQSQTQTTSGTQVEAQINLTPPGGGKAPLGVVNVVSQDGQRALAVVGQGLAASGHYVLWLRNGTNVKFMGFFPPVTGKGKSKGRLQGLVGAPTDMASYKEILVSREPSSKPTRPTAVVLQGSLTG